VIRITSDGVFAIRVPTTDAEGTRRHKWLMSRHL
jgi:hypothetical protein